MLLRLLTLPITGPLRLGWWVVEQVIGVAEAQLHDETAIVAALRDLERALDEGAIDEDEHAAAEAILLERLVAARAARRP